MGKRERQIERGRESERKTEGLRVGERKSERDTYRKKESERDIEKKESELDKKELEGGEKLESQIYLIQQMLTSVQLKGMCAQSEQSKRVNITHDDKADRSSLQISLFY